MGQRRDDALNAPISLTSRRGCCEGRDTESASPQEQRMSSREILNLVVTIFVIILAFVLIRELIYAI